MTVSSVLFQMASPSIAKDGWFMTHDLDDHDCDSEYTITAEGELHLIEHEAINIRASLEASGLLHQYPRYQTVPALGLQEWFSGELELLGSLIDFSVTVERGRVTKVNA